MRSVEALYSEDLVLSPSFVTYLLSDVREIRFSSTCLVSGVRVECEGGVFFYTLCMRIQFDQGNTSKSHTTKMRIIKEKENCQC